jgi:hypothetical protein
MRCIPGVSCLLHGGMHAVYMGPASQETAVDTLKCRATHRASPAAHLKLPGAASGPSSTRVPCVRRRNLVNLWLQKCGPASENPRESGVFPSRPAVRCAERPIVYRCKDQGVRGRCEAFLAQHGDRSTQHYQRDLSKGDYADSVNGKKSKTALSYACSPSSLVPLIWNAGAERRDATGACYTAASLGPSSSSSTMA